MGSRGPRKGQGGRRPLPTRLKEIRGTLRAGRVNPAEPTTLPGVPNPPSDFDSTQRRRWKAVAKKLDAIGVLSQVDDGALAAYVLALVRLSRANRRCNKSGEYVNVEGVMRLAPWAAERHRASQIVRQLAAEFGATPSSRTNVSSTVAARVDAEKDDSDEERDEFFGTAKD